MKGNDPHGGRGRVGETDMACVRVGHEMAGQNYCVVGGCLLSLSLCRRGFQDLLKVRPSSLFVLCGCISSLYEKLLKPQQLFVITLHNVLFYGFHSATCFRLTLRRLMSYIYGAPILDVSRSHTTTQHSR